MTYLKIVVFLRVMPVALALGDLYIQLGYPVNIKQRAGGLVLFLINDDAVPQNGVWSSRSSTFRNV